MSATSFVIEVHPVTPITTGAWCDQCNLPSAITAGFALVSASTLYVLRRFDVVSCQDCGIVTSRHP